MLFAKGVHMNKTNKENRGEQRDKNSNPSSQQHNKQGGS